MRDTRLRDLSQVMTPMRVARSRRPVGVGVDRTDDVARRLVADFGPVARVAIGVLSNTTTAFHTDLRDHGLTGVFDHIFTSTDLHVDKPCPLVFHMTAERMGVGPDEVFFTDDEQLYVSGARYAGMHAEVFVSPTDLADTLTPLGVPVRPRRTHVTSATSMA
jgi:FMN phosphatase YigB (HAD superfamily)